MVQKTIYAETGSIIYNKPAKSPKNKKKRKILIFFLYFLLFFGIFLGIFFSIKNLLFVDVTARQNYYIIYTTIDTPDYSFAESKATEYKSRGGAGVIIKNEEKYCVVLAVYPSLEFAQNVQSQLAKQNIKTAILTQPLKTLKLANLTTEQRAITQNIHQKYLETVDSLYQISVELDTDKTSQSYALIRVGELALLWEQRAQNLADMIAPAINAENGTDSHPLYPAYDMALYTASQLKYLANENTYQSSLKTLISVIRQINYTLCVI